MLIRFDFASDVPLYKQLRDQIVMAIAAGELSPGEKLPTVRTLADESGVNTMTISKAYQLLRQEGYIQTDRRAGAVVSAREGGKCVPQETLSALRLLLSELALAGFCREEALALCAQIFEEVRK